MKVFNDVVRLPDFEKDLKKLVNDYLEYLEIERNRASKTIENYGRYLNRFVQFVKTSSKTDLVLLISREPQIFTLII